MKKTLIWKTRDKKLYIKSLNDLFNALVDMDQEDIDEEIGLNINKEDKKVVEWVEVNFPKQLELIVNLRNIGEYTPQQIRERISRDLRKIISQGG